MHIWKLCAQANFLYLQTSTLIALSGVILCLCSHPPFCHSMRTSWISCSGGLMYTSGYMEMNKQVQPIDIFWASEIYVAFCTSVIPGHRGAFQALPEDLCTAVQCPFPTANEPSVLGASVWAEWIGVSAKPRQFCPLQMGAVSAYWAEVTCTGSCLLLCEHTWTGSSSWRALCGPCFTVEKSSLWRCKVHQRQCFALCFAGSASETGLRGSL